MAKHYINPYKLFHGCMVPNWLLERPEVSAGAKLCYARLAQFAGKAGTAFPGQDCLATELGVEERQVRRYLTELEGKHHLIESERPGLHKTNRYRFAWHTWMATPCPESTSAQERSDMSAQDRSDMSAQERSDMSAPGVRESLKENQRDPEPAQQKRAEVAPLPPTRRIPTKAELANRPWYPVAKLFREHWPSEKQGAITVTERQLDEEYGEEYAPADVLDKLHEHIKRETPELKPWSVFSTSPGVPGAYPPGHPLYIRNAEETQEFLRQQYIFPQKELEPSET